MVERDSKGRLARSEAHGVVEMRGRCHRQNIGVSLLANWGVPLALSNQFRPAGQLVKPTCCFNLLGYGGVFHDGERQNPM